MTKIDAVSEAKKIAQRYGWGYAWERFDGEWVFGVNKPSLRSGKVIEIDSNGMERYA